MLMQQRSPITAYPAPVIALHCSGAGAAQWRQLGDVLDSRYELLTPEHYGCDSVGPWSGERAFTLADEAARTIGIIDRSDCKVPLVGHSYGGGVALRAAVERPNRIASLTLEMNHPRSTCSRRWALAGLSRLRKSGRSQPKSPKG